MQTHFGKVEKAENSRKCNPCVYVYMCKECHIKNNHKDTETERENVEPLQYAFIFFLDFPLINNHYSVAAYTKVGQNCYIDSKDNF